MFYKSMYAESNSVYKESDISMSPHLIQKQVFTSSTTSSQCLNINKTQGMLQHNGW